MNLREQIKKGVLLLDGAMGSFLPTLTNERNIDCELAVLDHRDLVLEAHRQYLDAGSQGILTDTYNANRVFYHGDEELVKKVIHEAVSVAREAVEGYDAAVFADIGPLRGLEEGKEAGEFIYTVEQFLKEEVHNFVFETNSSAAGIPEALEYIRSRDPDAFIIVMFAVQADGYSQEGFYAPDLIRTIRDTGNADVTGLNCITGAREMLNLYENMDHEGAVFALKPSAGYPIVVNNRVIYESDPRYFGRKLAEMASLGVRVLGGCCGTTPEHIRQAAEALSAGTAFVSRPGRAPAKISGGKRKASPFWEKLQRGEKVVAVELDPPLDSDISRFIQGAYDLKEEGVDIITLADCPVGRVHMDSSLLACKLEREVSIEALPHLTCRDRNINATKALLLGLHAEGIKNILIVTGDPVPSSDRDEVKAVYQFNSRKLATFVTSLGDTVLPEPFHMFGALNLNARNFDIQLKLAKEKEERGMAGFLTQPVLTPEALENLRRAREEIHGFLLGGLLPPVSAKNARFMNSEISGIRVSEDIIRQYDGLERAEAEDLAVSLITDISQKVSPYVDGFYLITPFNRTHLIRRILSEMKYKEIL